VAFRRLFPGESWLARAENEDWRGGVKVEELARWRGGGSKDDGDDFRWGKADFWRRGQRPTAELPSARTDDRLWGEGKSRSFAALGMCQSEVTGCSPQRYR